MDAAVRFQDVLQGRLSDMDLVLFLDSSKACESQWVIDELTLANNLGLSVLQLVWPDKKPFSGAALSVPCQLRRESFVNHDHGSGGQLERDVLQEIMTTAEAVRVESLGLRRRRVIGEFLQRVADHGCLTAVLQPVGPIELRHADSDRFLAWAIPLVGLPTDREIHHEFTTLRGRWEDFGYNLSDFGAIAPHRFQVVYDALGVESRNRDHLDWLNKYLPLSTLRIDRDRQQPANPIEQWLGTLS